ncbi:dynactin subunit 4 isoform X1 [Acipenser oxyrinchus oxyrinchus]|uniref:Dynactin subunit 4 n=1 Tax=Acipenser oxyrinchus oxyrinchus TaxID=40147 RepID=A0AAD8D2H0_ACIOX|nr:dynactin subunit 4 isoform X1 [Acipenser oxyrinchus oxyrinchus]
MASLLQADRVLYLVSGEKKIRSPLSQLYYCRYCSELRSLECVSHEVDSHYCPSCLENMPSAEAKLKKNRCANCFDCPCCMHTLSTRATNIPSPLPDDPAKTTMKKAYYLACGFCRWTSRDVGMADKSVASGGWQEPENPHTQRINKLIEYYQQLAQREKAERDRKKLARRCTYMPLAFSQHTIHVVEKYGLGTRLQRQISGAPISGLAGLSLKEGEDQKEIKIEPVQALEEVEPLPEDYYTRPINLPEVTTLRQRLLQPDFQPIGASQLYPRHKHLLTKRSLRCRKCEHNLSKPEFNPTSIKFKIQLVALNYIPEVRIMSIPNLRYLKESQVLLTLTNPVENITHVTLRPCEEGDQDDLKSTATVAVSAKELLLAGKDAAAEYDELAEPQDFQDDPDVVAFRKSNKIGIFIKVTPQCEEGEVTLSFKMRHDFRNLAGNEPVWLTHHVELSLGPLAP